MEAYEGFKTTGAQIKDMSRHIDNIKNEYTKVVNDYNNVVQILDLVSRSLDREFVYNRQASKDVSGDIRKLTYLLENIVDSPLAAMDTFDK